MPWSSDAYITKTSLLFLLSVIIFSHLLYPKIVISSSHDFPHYVMYDCKKTNDTFISGRAFELSRNDTLYSKLLADASQVMFSTATNGSGIDQVNALYYCRADVGLEVCHNCVMAAVDKIIEQCKFRKEAVIWLEECTLRYSNRGIFFIAEEQPLHIYYNKTGLMNDYFLDPFKKDFDSAMDGLVKQAAHSENLQGFATKDVSLSSFESLHCVVQCSPDITGFSCEKCLRDALNQRDKWADTMIFMPSCFIRVDLYRSTIPPSSKPTGSHSLSTTVIIIIALVSAVLAVAIVAAVLFYFGYYPKFKAYLIAIKDVVIAMPSAIVAMVTAVCSRFRTYLDLKGVQIARRLTYAQLTEASNNFDDARLIGKGGYGDVFTGSLRLDENSETRTDVAIKKLKNGSNHRVPEFLSELNTSICTKHINIVEVVGYCHEDNHKLIVYEYLPNNCVYKHLHNDGIKPRLQNLTWVNRMDIAIGTAKALKYLHEDCNPKMVHRDIKSSNILLDINYQPKVADFGLAKVFSDDVTHEPTELRGTPSHWDPEYERRKKVTKKSDVYSFGMVLIELVTGRRPGSFKHPDQVPIILSLLQELESSVPDVLTDPAPESSDFNTSARYYSVSDGNGPKDTTDGQRSPAYDNTERTATEDSIVSVTGDRPKVPEALNNLVDPNLDADFDITGMACMIVCAAMCVHPFSKGRITMSQVVKLLDDGSLLVKDVKELIKYARSKSDPGSSDYNEYPKRLGLASLKRLATQVLTKR